VMIGLGPSLSEWLFYAWGYEASFVLVLVAFAGMAWLVARLPRSLIDSSRPRPGFAVVFKASFVRLRNILIFSVFFGLCGSAWNGFLAPAVRHLGAGAVSAFGFGYAVGAVMTRLGFSHRLDSQGRRLVGIGTLLPYGAALALIPHALAPWNLLLLGLVCGMGHGIFYPSLSSLAAERFHPLYPGQGMSLYVSASALGYFVGPPLWGALIDKSGYGLVFAVAGALLTIATAVFVVGESAGDRATNAVD